MGAMRHNQPNKNTLPYMLLELTAITGELPADQLIRLSANNNKYKEAIVTTLKTDKLIRTYYRDKLRGYRLTSRAKKMLLSDNGERFTFFLTGVGETNRPKSEVTRRFRLHRIAETYITMLNAGIHIHRDTKPDIFYPADSPASVSHTITAPCFYSSREIKELGTEHVKIKNARTVGTLLTEAEAYIVYNTGGSIMKWEYKTELRTKAMMKSVLCIERLPQQYTMESVRALLLGDTMDLAYQLLTSTGGIEKNFFVIDGTYDCFHYITNDHNGEVVLRLLCDLDKRAAFDALLSADLYERQPGAFIANDATDENGDPVLFAYSFDMTRIIRFNKSLMLHDRRGTILCFDFQADVLRRYCCQNTQIQTISLHKFERRFFP